MLYALQVAKVANVFEILSLISEQHVLYLVSLKPLYLLNITTLAIVNNTVCLVV